MCLSIAVLLFTQSSHNQFANDNERSVVSAIEKFNPNLTILILLSRKPNDWMRTECRDKRSLLHIVDLKTGSFSIVSRSSICSYSKQTSIVLYNMTTTITSSSSSLSTDNSTLLQVPAVACAWRFHAPSRTLTSTKPLAECRPHLELAQHNFVYRVQPGALKVRVWRFVGGGSGNNNNVHPDGNGVHTTGVSSTIYGVIFCDDPIVQQRASVVIGTFPTKKLAEEQLTAFVAAVEEVMARVPLTDPEPVSVRPGDVPQAAAASPTTTTVVSLNYRLKGWRMSDAEFTQELTPVRFFPRVLLGRMTLAAWDALVSPLAHLEQPEQMPWYYKLLICPPVACLGGLCYLLMKIQKETEGGRDAITEQAERLLAQPTWKVTGLQRNTDRLTVELVLPV